MITGWIIHYMSSISYVATYDKVQELMRPLQNIAV